MTEPRGPLPLHPYQLLEIHYDRINARRLRNEPTPEDVPTPLNVQITCREPVDNVCEARLNVSVGEPDSTVLIYYIHLDVVCSIRGPSDGSPELLKQFARQQAVGLLWPYARELVQTLSLRLGINSLLLPTLQVVAVGENLADVDGAPDAAPEGQS